MKQLLVYTLYSTNACFAIIISSLLFASNCICCNCEPLNKQRLDFFSRETESVFAKQGRDRRKPLNKLRDPKSYCKIFL